jgi:hypothetical protein
MTQSTLETAAKLEQLANKLNDAMERQESKGSHWMSLYSDEVYELTQLMLSSASALYKAAAYG